MRKFLLALVLAFSVVACAEKTKTPTELAHASAHQIRQKPPIGSPLTCSATAIGPHALLTATHCEAPTDDLLIRHADRVAIVVQRFRDGNDHTIYLIKNVTFADYVIVDLSNKLGQGTNVFMFGCPGTLQDMYRRGYVAGKEEDMILFDMADWHGDSGAGIFSEDGKLVAVVSLLVSQSKPDELENAIRFTGAFPLAFTQEQLDKARAFSIADDPED